MSEEKQVEHRQWHPELGRWVYADEPEYADHPDYREEWKP